MGDEAGESSFLPMPAGAKVNRKPIAFGLKQWHADRIGALAQPAPHGCGIDVGPVRTSTSCARRGSS